MIFERRSDTTTACRQDAAGPATPEAPPAPDYCESVTLTVLPFKNAAALVEEEKYRYLVKEISDQINLASWSRRPPLRSGSSSPWRSLSETWVLAWSENPSRKAQGRLRGGGSSAGKGSRC
ncbi:MAG: hypothetical protein ACYC8T_18070 [Myxococcaceae bacterium]